MFDPLEPSGDPSFEDDYVGLVEALAAERDARVGVGGARIPPGWYELDAACRDFSFASWASSLAPLVVWNEGTQRPKFGQRFRVPITAVHRPLYGYDGTHDVRAAVADLFVPRLGSGPVHREHVETLGGGAASTLFFTGWTLIAAVGVDRTGTGFLNGVIKSAVVWLPLGLATLMASGTLYYAVTLLRPEIVKTRDSERFATWCFDGRRETRCDELARVLKLFVRSGFDVEVRLSYCTDGELSLHVEAIHTRRSQRFMARFLA